MFKQLVDAQFPTLAAHMEGQGVNVASVSTQWFLCLFVNSLPLETCLRVWDLLFLERCASVLFRIALTLVDIYSLVGPPPFPLFVFRLLWILPSPFAFVSGGLDLLLWPCHWLSLHFCFCGCCLSFSALLPGLGSVCASCGLCSFMLCPGSKCFHANPGIQQIACKCLDGAVHC